MNEPENSNTNRNSLIVPISVDAMCIGETDATQRQTHMARCTATFLGLPYKKQEPPRAYLSDNFLSKPFRSEDALENGVHLHWALPDALTHGQVSYQLTPEVFGALNNMGIPEAVRTKLEVLKAREYTTDNDFLKALVKTIGADDADQYQLLILQAAGQIKFPVVPNRWLVVRILTITQPQASPATSLKAWVVESDFLSLDADRYFRSITVPYSSNQGSEIDKAFRFMGRAVPLEEWHEAKAMALEDERFSRLTAVGYGEPTFAAYYPNCKSVFGFRDDFKDVPNYNPANSHLSYVVAGWYSDPADDPLAASEVDIEKTLKAFRWELLPKARELRAMRTILSGMVQNVRWNPGEQYLPDNVNDDSIQVAIGNTAAEALSAYLAATVPSDDAPGLEIMLEALRLGSLGKLHAADGMAQLENALHANAFGSVDGGIMWTVKKKESEQTEASRKAEVPELPAKIASLLNDLNINQQQCHRSEYEIASRRWQIFADWHKYLSLSYPPPSPEGIMAETQIAYLARLDEDKDALATSGADFSATRDYFEASNITPSHIREVLEHEMGRIDELGKDLNVLRAKIGTQAQQLRLELDKLNAELAARLKEVKPDISLEELEDRYFLLQRVPAQRFWQPNEPVVLLAGEAVQPSLRFGADGRYSDKGMLLCRTTDQIVTALALNEPQAVIRADDLPGVAHVEQLPIAAEVQALVGEAFMLDPSQAPAVASCTGTEGPVPAALGEAVRDIQNRILEAPDDTGTFQGMVPSPLAVTRWKKQPWHPLFMQWRIQYIPLINIQRTTQSHDYEANVGYEPDFIESLYDLAENRIDLTPKAPAPADLPAPHQYEGSILLTPHAVKNLKSQVESYLPGVPAAVLRQIDDMPVLSQSLSGLNAALIMRAQQLQFEIRDPFQLKRDKLPARVKEAVANMNYASPVPNWNYNPIRAGYMRITALRIIDAFGQIRVVKLPYPIRARSLIPPKDRPNTDIVSAPRMVQPCRLLWQWLSGDDDKITMNAHPASTPVCGWLLLNHLDSSIMIYDQKGRAVGSLIIRATGGDSGQPIWQPAPGSNQPLLEETNRHLNGFVDALRKSDTAFLRRFMQTIERAQTCIEPPNQQRNAMAMLVGRPLALVRASLSLELQGLPAYNQSYPAFKPFAQRINDGKPAQRDSCGFPAVRFPVALGDPSLISDGLIGYFLENDQGLTDYQQFYSNAADRAGQGVQPAAGTIQVSLDAQPLILTMLVDPRAKVNAVSGILPVKALEIPPSHYTEALAAMEVTFLTLPVISKTERLGLPLPNVEDRTWQWIGPSGIPADIGPVSQKAGTEYTPQQISEGWLSLRPYPPK